MHSGKLIEILKTFSKKDFQKLEEKVSQTDNDSLISFLATLQDYQPRFDHENLEKKFFYKLVFPEKPYDEKNMWYLMSQLVQLSEDVIVEKKIGENIHIKNQYLLDYYNDHGIERHFKQTLKKAQKELNQNLVRNVDFFYHNYMYAFQSDVFFGREEKRTFDESLQLKSNYFDTYFIATKLKQCCEMINRKNLLGGEYDMGLYEEVKSYVQQSDQGYLEIPAVAIYFQITLLLQGAIDEDTFDQLKEKISENVSLFTKMEVKEMFGYLQNYCVRKINSGNLDYLPRLFSIYELLLESEAIFENGNITQWDYKNIVFLGLRLKKYDWTYHFIDQYKEALSKKVRESAYAYNLASYHYFKKEYDKVQDLLQTITFPDLAYNLQSKLLLIKTYYEKNEIVAMYNLIDSFKALVSRNKKIQADRKESYQNMVKYTKQLFDVKMGTRDEKILDKVKKALQENKNIGDKKWLLEKLEELS